MSMHLNHLHALEQVGGAVWRRFCALRDQHGLPGSIAAGEYHAFCMLWQEHPERLKLECERDEAQVSASSDEATADADAVIIEADDKEELDDDDEENYHGAEPPLRKRRKRP